MKPYIAYILTNLKLTWRDRMVVFFNFVFPLIFFFTFAQAQRAEQGGAINQVFASVVVIGVLGNGFFGGGIRAVVEREANILRRFKVAPITPAPILLAAVVVGLVNYLPSVLMLFAISHFQYGMAVPQNWLSALIVVCVGTVAFRAMGQIIASVANSSAESQIIIQILYFPMLFLSGTTFPVWLFPKWLQGVTQFIPATHLYAGVQNVLLRGENAWQNAPALLALLLTTALSLFISMKLFRWEKGEKLKPAAKLWIVAVLTPFFVVGAYQSYTQENLTKSRQVTRELRRSRNLLIKDARVFTGDGPIYERASILIREGRIAEIYTGAVPDAKDLKAEPIEAAGKTVMPGLIDVHVHLGAPGGFYENPQDYQQKRPFERELAAYLYSGVTAVKSVGDAASALLTEQKRIASGERLGAEVFLCGPLFTAKGGHGTEYAKYMPENMRAAFDAEFVRLPGSPDEARRMVRELKAQGVSGIKAVMEAGYGGRVFNRLDPGLLKAIAEEAKAQGLPLVVHTGDRQDIEDAIAVGAAGVEHGSMRDRIPESLIERMKASGVFYDPTLAVLEAASEFAQGRTDLLDRSLVQQVGPAKLLLATRRMVVKRTMPGANPLGDFDPMAIARDNLRRVYAGGVNVVTGSDAGNPGVIHGPTIQREVQLWVAAGIPSHAALKAATYDAARLLGASHRIGAIRKGFDATLILLNGDPVKDISAIEALSGVIFKGERVDRSSLFDEEQF
jgi:imidazolonepropionase-like amidohydrolase/ABC-type multidrug transport system permease subunit